MIGNGIPKPVLAALLGAVLGLGACGLYVPASLAPNHAPKGFRLLRPDCEPASRPEPRREDADPLIVQTLGVSGLYLEWHGQGLLLSPFFSRKSAAKLGLETWRSDFEAIEAGLAALPLDKIRAVLVGHGHYDHLGDIPFIAGQLLPQARILANRTSAHQLNPYEDLRGRIVDMEESLGQWLPLRDGDGQPLPLRVMALATTHAPQLGPLRWAAGATETPWTKTWDHKRSWQLRQGLPLAFLIDLLDPASGEVRFRLYANEAASDEGTGYPPAGTLAERSVDVAFLCLASYRLASGYPESLLEALSPSHLVANHYDDFFRPYAAPPRLVPALTPRRARRFLERADSLLNSLALTTNPPSTPLCGPSGPRLSMPLPGEWMAFSVPRPQEGPEQSPEETPS